MTVEQVVDDYLHDTRKIVGTAPAPTASAPAEAAIPQFPDASWTGDAHQSAIDASAALADARRQLATAAGGVANITADATHIASDASAQLDSITNDWKHAKSAVAVLPPGQREAALLPAAQTAISESVTLISATTSKYEAAAAKVRKHTAQLPNDSTSTRSPENARPGPTLQDGAPHADAPTSPQNDATVGNLDALTGAAATTTTAAAESPAAGLAPTAAGALPTLIGPAMSMPASLMPMAAALPQAAFAPLGGMLSPLVQSATASQPPATEQAGPHPSTGSVPTTHPGQPGSVVAAIDQALDALGINDPEHRQNWREGYQTLIRRESTNNPHAINNDDRNATGPILADGGHAGSSRGYAQVTPSTFRAYHVPGTSDDIMDPVANIASSMNYVIHEHHVSPSGTDLMAKVAQANPRSRGGGY